MEGKRCCKAKGMQLGQLQAPGELNCAVLCYGSLESQQRHKGTAKRADTDTMSKSPTVL